MRRVAAALLAGLLLLSGCERRAPGTDTPPSQREPAAEGQPPLREAPAQSPDPAPEGEAPATGGNAYIASVAEEVAESLLQPGMGEYDKAKAAFDYMIASTVLVDPIGLDLWRIRGEEGQAKPAYVEQRSLSVLLFGAGMCEDYAAAFATLLRAMGLEAQYVPGLTYSTQGALVDHAWVVARIDGTWYHLDCQLEDNISRQGAIRYRYFMKSDETMAGSHRWGKNLIDGGLLTPEQNAILERDYTPPACPQDYAAPARSSFTAAPEPDLAALQAEIDAEFAAYEAQHGALPPLELDIIPPVFGTAGYGPEE